MEKNLSTYYDGQCSCLWHCSVLILHSMDPPRLFSVFRGKNNNMSSWKVATKIVIQNLVDRQRLPPRP
jgi:hypothetical protein